MTDNSLQLADKFSEISHTIKQHKGYQSYGIITKITGFLLEASGICSSVGARCLVYRNDNSYMHAEVIGFHHQTTYLMTLEDPYDISPGNRICIHKTLLSAKVGIELLGRVIDGIGRPIDNQGRYQAQQDYPLHGNIVNPIHRTRITTPLDVGVKAINSLLTVGMGQRMGIFAGSGVGKSTLLGMITRNAKADIVVVGLIGERGREVKEFIEENLSLENLAKTIVIAAPIDTSPLMRTNGALLATTIAEYFRDCGLNVLLILDSLTRYAQALRQVYLSLGEMPSSKGFSPSVFAKISQLVERTGANGKGTITAFYTVLVEGDEMHDPIFEHARSILDGHINLSKNLAESGHYPAIDVNRSISRIMNTITDNEHQRHAQHIRRLLSDYEKNHELIQMGMYQVGADPRIDQAIQHQPAICQYLQQATHAPSNLNRDITELRALIQCE